MELLFLFDFLLILAMSAFHQDGPPAARRPWLLALPGYYLLVPVPVLVIQATGNQAWLPDSAGLACLVVSLFCLAHAPRALARSAQTSGSGVWSLALMLLAGVAGVWRIVSLGSYVHDPHLIDRPAGHARPAARASRRVPGPDDHALRAGQPR